MLRICIKPTTYEILPFQDKQNPYVDTVTRVNKKKVIEQHDELEMAFKNMVTYTINSTNLVIPDIVFVANGGLCLPRLPKPIVVLPYMKYRQRKNEIRYLEEMFKKLNIETVMYPGETPFEGQAELKWFHGGKLAIGAYGYRSTKKSFEVLKELLAEVYGSYKLDPPEMLVVPLKAFDYYHLDVAMLEFDDKKCIIHKGAFSDESIEKIKDFLGPKNVHIIDTTDSFCLNAVVDGDRLITHKLKSKSLRKHLENITGKTIKEINTSEFEKAGGSVRCMTLDIFTR